uniref:Cytochrome c oxidase assembly protein COX19 n=1 Tax=Amphora coffeiformis TaxID=265554 RepID=A0A7S3LF83_9STRA|mmetsp:Transcript_7242/g.13822  ORF Transcript_7242/g.13822 Transcript_7242/m.13822 type:complete len:125 (+) Transcript_7242:123-497(+)
MSSTSMSSGKQSVVRPPQRGIFPLDHYGDCQSPMKAYLECLQQHDDAHYHCKEFSRSYLQCRMDHDLMAKENLDQLGFSEAHQVQGAREYDKSKEKAGYTAGKHIAKESKWWWQSSDKKSWQTD